MKTLIQIVCLGLILGGCKISSRTESNSGLQAKAIAHTESITEKYWKLIELYGKPVSTGGRDAFITLRNENNRVNGNTGCNTITGTYEIDPTRYRIKFSQMATTMMACLNMEVENELIKILNLVDNYTMTADGKHLTLNRARMVPLALFEVVYME